MAAMSYGPVTCVSTIHLSRLHTDQTHRLEKRFICIMLLLVLVMQFVYIYGCVCVCMCISRNLYLYIHVHFKYFTVILTVWPFW